MEESKQEKFERIDKLVDLKLGKMEETLYDKIFSKVRYYLSEENIDDVIDISKACERVCVQAQIVMLQIINQNLELHCENEKLLNDKEPVPDYRNFINGKIQGIKLAIENNRQEIQELEKQQ